MDGKGAGIRGSINSGKRLALVIGNAKYNRRPLNNPANDATAMAQVLRESGFEVITGFDLTKTQLEEKILQFGQRLNADKSVGLFYYSGHGMQVDGENYLLPVDFDIDRIPDRRLAKNYATNIALVLNYMEIANNRFNLVILDACRDNPFETGWKSITSKGLATIEATSGTLIAYATAPNQTASDGLEKLSPYTSSLIGQIKIQGQTIYDVFSNVGEEVEEITHGNQQPWIASSLRGKPFCFRDCNQPGNNTDSHPIPQSKPFSSPSELTQSKPASFDTRGLNLDWYCQQRFGVTSVPTFKEGDAYSWRCLVKGVNQEARFFSMNLNDACKLQYGSDFGPMLNDAKEARSWKCTETFSFDYDKGTLPGERKWFRKDVDSWIEQIPDRSETCYRVVGEETVNGAKGAVVKRCDNAFEAFLPNLPRKDKWLMFRINSSQSWYFLGVIK
jgi:uncharacterized caspase-like protein